MRTLIALLLALPIAASAQGDVRKDLDRLGGAWLLLSAGGQALPAGAHAGLIFTGDKYQGLQGGKVNETGTIKLDPSTKPMSIDLLIATGSSAGQTQLGIVEVAGDTMTLTLAEPGSSRPDASAAANRLVLTRLKPLAKELEGSWEGALDVRGQLLHLVVVLKNGTDGLASGTLISVDQGNSEVAIAAVAQTATGIKLVIPAVRGGFEGELKGGQITGTWTQTGASLPLLLKRKP